MFALHKNRLLASTLLIWIPVVCLTVFLVQRLWSSKTAGYSTMQSQVQRMSNSSDLKERVTSISSDGDSDGIPDAAELRSFSDREIFRRSLTGIAEMQFYQLSNHWNPEQRDCSGLVRFAWREALRRHDRAWFRKMGPGYEQLVLDTSAARLDQTPLGEQIFRTDFGSYKGSDLVEGKFSEFADARTLKNFNTKYIGRDRRLAQPGDLIFYHQPWVQKFPYHVMIFLGESRVTAADARDWVVYHTGASSTDAGTVKKVGLSVLDQHPNKRWRPVESNPNFLGFYRLKVLD